MDWRNAHAAKRRTMETSLLTTINGKVRGQSERLHFGRDGEAKLSAWLDDNARVSWVEHSAPWEVEAGVIERLSLPLNLADNSGHAFYPTLKRVRAAARVDARQLPVVAKQRRLATDTLRTPRTPDHPQSRPIHNSGTAVAVAGRC